MKVFSFITLIFLYFLVFNQTFAQSSKIKVEPIDKNKLEKLIKERNGKPLFLNLWATWCAPCKEEFPSINKLANEFQEVEFVGISIDYPEDVKTKVIPFLKSQKAKFVSYVNAFEKDDELINFLEEKWNGAIPATFLYDEKGNKYNFIEGKKSYEEFKNHILQLFKK